MTEADKVNPHRPHHKLTRHALILGIIFTAYPMLGYAVTAGRADFVIGNVEVVAADGSRRILSKGSEISAGDAINTSQSGRAQLRFIDGGYVSLQPNTVFRVDEFNYSNKSDGSEKSFFSLLKGGLRAITGAIGKINRDGYKVTTATASIGIRGTGYKAEVRDDGLLVSVGEGAVLLTNNAGVLLISAGGGALVTSINTPPARTKEQPNLPAASIQPLTRPIASITQPDIPKLVSGSGYAMAYAGNSSIVLSSRLSATTATFNTLSQLTQYSGKSPDMTLVAGDIASANVTFAATDGILGWGRWDGSYYITDINGTSTLTTGTFHYVIGQPTAVMPTTGLATYSLLGYSNPTASDGSTGWSVKGDLSVDFANPVSGLGITMNVSNTSNSKNYAITGTGLAVAPTISGSVSTTGCSITCFTAINGFFAGTNATRAGLSYQINDLVTVEGVAAFAKN